MSILTGPMTVRKFRVVGNTPNDLREKVKDGLNSYGIVERPRTQDKQDNEGWVLTSDILSSNFDNLNQWLFDPYAIFALRRDKMRLPGTLFRATLAQKLKTWCAENNVERCPSSVKKNIKEELEYDWMKRAFPNVSVIEVCWDFSTGVVLASTLSPSMCEMLQKRFFRSFGLKLVPWSPLDEVANSAEVDRLLTVGPFQMSFGFESAP